MTNALNRRGIAELIAQKLRTDRQGLAERWRSSGPVRHLVVDGLLPEAQVLALSNQFPDPEKLMLRSSLRERKRVGVEIAKYPAAIAEHLFAFQEPEVVRAIAEITGLRALEPDPTLYASGISIMGKGDFLRPHLDNSHDGDGKRYRVLNLLFYVSPGWRMENGGSLELWDPRVTKPVTLVSQFNRLVVMETHNASWHSVSRVLVDRPRYCLSNYYFSQRSPLGGKPYTQVTTFAGRPEEPVIRLALLADNLMRNLAGRLLPAYRSATRHRIPSAR